MGVPNLLKMNQLSLLLFFLSAPLLCGQINKQDNQYQLSIRQAIRKNSEAKKEYRKYQLKSIGGAAVGTAGVVLLNHSLGTISPRQDHKWEHTLLATGLIGTGLWITKGAKHKRQNAIDLVRKKNKTTIALTGNGIQFKF